MKGRIEYAFVWLCAAELVARSFDADSLLSAADPADGCYLSTAAVFRGDATCHEAEAELACWKNRRLQRFLPWVTGGPVASICPQQPRLPACGLTCVSLASSTALQQLLRRQASGFRAMFRKRVSRVEQCHCSSGNPIGPGKTRHSIRQQAYLHWYLQEGMTEAEFRDAYDQLDSAVSGFVELETSARSSASNATDAAIVTAAAEPPLGSASGTKTDGRRVE